MQPTTNLDEFNELTPQQRRAIQMIVSAEAAGIEKTRLFKTPYSCQYCGRTIGRPTTPRNDRKALLAAHERECDEAPQRWKFAANHSTFYSKWKKDKLFQQCLAEATRQVVGMALDEATRILQLGTPEAARELRCQIISAEKESDRRAAAIALLDRADVQTASKELDPIKEWLIDLREAGEESTDGE